MNGSVASEQVLCALSGSNVEFVHHTAMSDLYRLVILFLQFPTAQTVESMEAESIAPDFISIAEELGIGSEDVGILPERLNALQKDLLESEDPLGLLRREHTRLFTNPQGPLVPPYEGLYCAVKRGDGSVARGEAMLIVNPAAMDVERACRQIGFALGSDNRFPADGATVELEYMAHLHDAVSRAILDSDEELSLESLERICDFYNMHISKWMPDFFSDIARVSRIEFHSIAAELGALLCRLEAAFLPIA